MDCLEAAIAILSAAKEIYEKLNEFKKKVKTNYEIVSIYSNKDIKKITELGSGKVLTGIAKRMIKDIINERGDKIGAIQIPGAGSGLRIAGELIKNKLENKFNNDIPKNYYQIKKTFKKLFFKKIYKIKYF